MKKVSKDDFLRIRRWIYKFARHLDVTQFQYYFEEGTKEAVLEALSVYQNEDGGFGHGLEFDCQNPNSSPIQTLWAYSVLKDLGCAGKDNPMIRGIISFFENCEYITEKGCYWSIPSNNHYPCHPWYFFPNAPWFPSDWPVENYTNNGFINFVLEYFAEDSELYKKVLRIIDYRLSVLPDLATFFTFAKSDIEQSIETDDWLGLIKSLESYNLKSNDECKILLSRLLEILKKAANPTVYENVKKKIKMKNDIDSEGLDEIVDGLCNHKDWSMDGLRCDNPEKRINEMLSFGYLWWPINDAIKNLNKLKSHGRLEI